MEDWVSKLEEIVRLDKQVKKKLEQVEKLSGLVSYFKEYVECDPYNVDCDHVSYGEWVNRLKEWVELYARVEKIKDPRKIPEKIPWKFKVYLNYAEGKVLEICSKDRTFDCVVVDKKLPLDEEARKKILTETKRKIEKLLDEMPLELARLVLTVLTEILPSIKHRIEWLEQDYRKLEQKIKEVYR